MTDPRRRVSPRLSFTGRPAPRLETDSRSYEIVDLSPTGLRFRVTEPARVGVTIGDVLHATIRFPADRAVEIEGRVLRVAGQEAAVQVERGQDLLAAPMPMGPVPARRFGLLW
jgi:PilZ domain